MSNKMKYLDFKKYHPIEKNENLPEKEGASNDITIKDLTESRKRNFGKEMMIAYNLSKEIRILCWIMTTPVNHKTKAQKVCNN